MHTAINELNTLVNYLNQDWRLDEKKLSRFLRSLKGKERRELMEHRQREERAHERLRNIFAGIVAPALLIPPAPNNPKFFLQALIGDVNTFIAKYPVQLQYWAGVPNNDPANLHIRDFSFRLNRSDRNSVARWGHEFCYKVARILENDELDLLGLCRICTKFFVRKRPWQKCCSQKCKKTLDNRLYAERKSRRVDGKRKSELLGVLQDTSVIKRFPGTPHARWRMQEELARKLRLSRSLNAFWSQCPPECRKVLERYLPSEN
jgi:hypothetical protein